MTTPALQPSSTPRWHRPLLPGELRENADGRRSARDWVVDAALYTIAVAVGVLVLVDTWSEHGDVILVVDVGLGVACLVALWWRRSHPGAVGVLTATASIVSGLAAGPGLVAGFNVAVRGSRREIVAVVAISAVAIFVAPLLYPTGDPYLLNVVLGTLLTAVVIGWASTPGRAASTCSRCASARPGWRPSSGCASSRRATPSGA